MRPVKVLLLAGLAALLGSVARADPALDTCEGAMGKFSGLTGQTCEKDGDTGEQTPGSCGNAECAALISSIDDDALANMKTGLQV